MNSTASVDIFTQLRQQHDALRGAFGRFRASQLPWEKRKVIRDALEIIRSHQHAVETRLSPLLRSQNADPEVLEREMHGLRVMEGLMAEIEKSILHPDDVAAKFQVLGIYARHRMAEEEREFLPLAENSYRKLTERSKETPISLRNLS
jgi:hypothetical protein